MKIVILALYIIVFSNAVRTNSFEKIENDADLLRFAKCIKHFRSVISSNNEISRYELAVKIFHFAKNYEKQLDTIEILAFENIIKKLKNEFSILGVTLIIIDKKLSCFENSQKFLCNEKKGSHHFKKNKIMISSILD